MNLEEVQNYFKDQISKGNYDVVRITGKVFTRWISLKVNDRPFLIKVNELDVMQEGEIDENYIQLGDFSKQQKQIIYERYRDEIERY
jgi:hypothetical protein